MNWKKVEGTLLDASVTALHAFAHDHAAETFYGFCFDVNADYGEVLLSLNTEDDLVAWAERTYPTYPQREIDSTLRWNVGDWKYHGFNTDKPYAEAWDKAWEETQDALHDAYLDDESAEVPEHFLQSVCRVLIDLERKDAFAPLARTERFKTLVTDHDEPIEDAWARLLKVRNRRR